MSQYFWVDACSYTPVVISFRQIPDVSARPGFVEWYPLQTPRGQQ